MPRVRIVGLAFCLLPAAYVVGCATQETGISDPSVEPGAGTANNGGASGGSTNAGKGGSTASGGSTSGGSTNGGSTTTGGTSDSGGAPDEGGAGGADGAIAGSGGSTAYDGTCANQNHAQCDDGNPCTTDACNVVTCQHVNNTEPCTDDGNECTDDICGGGTCTHPANTADCADDGDDCTDDVCAGGTCTHPDSGVCECEEDIDCNDDEPCTDDECLPDKTCEHTNNTGDCPDDGNECTDDVCGGGSCTHPPNTDPCTDDGTDCTNDVCSGGSCQHTNNQTCECLVAADCDSQENDPDNCTFNRCTVGGNCDFVDNDSCETGDDFVVNNFNDSGDWTSGPGGTSGTDSGVTTPDDRPLAYANFVNTNIEIGQRVYLADAADGTAASLEMGLASMVGLHRLAIIITASSTGTASMVSVGVFDGSWHDLPLATYAAIPDNQYATIEIPLLDFDVPLSTITKMRMLFNATGQLREWRIDQIEVRPPP